MATVSSLDAQRRPALPAGKGLVTRALWQRWLRIVLAAGGVVLVVEGVQRAQERETAAVYRSTARSPLVPMSEVAAAIDWMAANHFFTPPDGAVSENAELGRSNPGGLRFTGLLTKPKLRKIIPWLLARVEMRFENVSSYRVL